ncbi:MAG: TetR/AcrR family transcriptional regulator [Flavobacteriaceae bacterium]|nr:TetR/AcrR family transcriptional regulator [Flavobacteriaceae bacterium]
MTKSEKTTQYIIEIAAPIFNKKGYAATSLSDITKATRLTKGAIYGNFRNKEHLAISVCNFNGKQLIKRLKKQIQTSDSPLEQLFLITSFFRYYLSYTKNNGGCPILHFGMDAHDSHAFLKPIVQQTLEDIKQLLTDLINKGKAKKELSFLISTEQYTDKILSLTYGGIALAHISNNPTYLNTAMNEVEKCIMDAIQN